jgi:hypothetical protein
VSKFYKGTSAIATDGDYRIAKVSKNWSNTDANSNFNDLKINLTGDIANC